MKKFQIFLAICLKVLMKFAKPVSMEFLAEALPRNSLGMEDIKLIARSKLTQKFAFALVFIPGQLTRTDYLIQVKISSPIR